MTVKSNSMIAIIIAILSHSPSVAIIATLGEWLKNLTPVFPTNEKQKQSHPMHEISPTL